MTKIGFHASHEQFPPSKLLQWTRRAEDAGFDCFFCSDHFHPWSEAQGQAGFSWAWMGAALQATRIPGRIICCPGFRYHPATVAQDAATLAEMFPDRFDLAIGSGQALNERITGECWPLRLRGSLPAQHQHQPGRVRRYLCRARPAAAKIGA